MTNSDQDAHTVTATTGVFKSEESFAEAIGQINALPYEPAFVVHTADLTHLATAAQFDQVQQMMTGQRTGRS